MHEATLNQTNIKHAEAIEQTIWKVKHALKQEYDVLLSAWKLHVAELMHL